MPKLHRTIPFLTLLLGCPSDSAPQSDSDTDTEGIGSVGDGDDGGSTMTDSGTDGSGSTGDGLNCGESQFELEAQPTKVMLVLDKSASMVNNTWDHDADTETAEVTRWFSLHETVSNITTTFDASLDFGAILYPSLDATSDYAPEACLVAEEPEVPIAPGNGAAVVAGIPPADAMDQIQGGTPARAAVEVAVAQLQSFNASQERAIIFVTDGEANCQAEYEDLTELFEVYDQALHDVVGQAFADSGIATYVVGIAIRDEVLPSELDGAPDGINPSAKLDELAELGGRPLEGGATKYYATDNQVELDEALAQIVGQAFNCVVPLDPPPQHPDFLEIVIGGETVPGVTDCASEDGWVFVNPDGPYDAIELCGSSCDLLAQEGTLQALYMCPPSG